MSEGEPINEKPEHTAVHSSAGDDDDILSAVRRRDWSCLRTLSLRAGGFGERRKHVWPFLLHADMEASSTGSEDEAESTSSPMRRRRRRTSSLLAVKNEDDVGETRVDAMCLSDTVPHPDERQIKLDTDRSFVLYSVGQTNREELQAELNEFITSVFRRYPQLSYFQGYHDIITVLFLTLPESEQLLCAEKMSLHRLRDAMGKGLEPLLGLLQILKYLLRLADPDYAALLERNTPLPYFALSNLLTLFSHDVPTLPLIQHVFDFLLCRPPIAVVYLAAVVTLARKDEAIRMEQEGEEGMLHSLLSSLPELSDGDKPVQFDYESGDSDVLQDDLPDPVSTKNELISEPVQTATMGEENSTSDAFETTDGQLTVERSDSEHTADRGNGVVAFSGMLPQSSQGFEGFDDSQHLWTGSESSFQMDGSQSATLPGSSIVSNLSSSDLRSSEPPEMQSSSRPASPQSHTSSDHASRLTVSLPALLEHADTLFVRYPPSHPALHVSAIMGPQSVVFTWSEDSQNMVSDAEAEKMTARPDLVVLPFVDPDEIAAMKEAEKASDGRQPRRKLRKRMHGKHFGVRLDKKTVLTGTVVALSVAVAVYSMRAKGNGGVLDISRSDRTWRKTARVASGILIGTSERIFESFGWQFE